MSRSLKTVIVNGSLSRPSRTRVLLDALHARLGQELPLQAQVIDLLDLQPHLGAALSKNDLPPATLQAIEAIEQADFLFARNKEEIADIFKCAGFGFTEEEFNHIYEQATHLDAGGKVSVESFRKVLNGPSAVQPFVR